MAQSTARYSIVMPVMNRTCKVPTSIPISLSPSISLRKIRGDDLAVITEGHPGITTFLTGGRFTLVIDDFPYEAEGNAFSDIVLCASFVLNVISSGSALAFDKAFVLRHLRKTKVAAVHSLNGHHHAYMSDFNIASKDTIENVSELFSSTDAATKAYPALKLTLSRLNSAAGRVMIDEKVVDLCISLESVFQAQTEISFQFALHNTILSEPDKQKRVEIFNLLKQLYKQRSNIVHGNRDVDATWCVQNFARLLAIAKTSVLQKIDFLNANAHGEWKASLERRALGVE